MTPQERDLISGVFDRLERNGVGQKDGEAETLIAARAKATPDAVYGLTQAVIVLEIGLTQAQQKIAELERQLESARVGQQAPATGSFLGGASPWGGSVPRSGAPAAASGVSPRQAPAQAPYPPQYAQPSAPMPPQYAPQQSAGGFGGGGFLRNAATMAAGVAGGTLIAEGLSSLFGGHRGFGGYGGGLASSPWGTPQGGMVENVTVNNYYDGQAPQGADPAQDAGFSNADSSGSDDYADNGVQDASYDDGSGFGGDFGGFDDGTDV